jgi:hypothetical protein
MDGRRERQYNYMLHCLFSSPTIFIQTTLATGFSVSNKSVLIMDEVDGMSAGDRGGVGALNALIKKTKVCLKWDLV